MRTAIVIPARLAATRLPNKPLALLGDTPLVVRTMRQAMKCRSATRVIVATDSDAIAAAVRAHGGTPMLTRAEHSSGTDRIAEVAADLDVDLVLNLQGDEPFVDPGDLETVIDGLASQTVEMATLKAPVEDDDALQNPNVVKVVSRDDHQALYFSRAPIPFARHGGAPLTGVWRHVGVYGYRKDALLRLAATPPHFLEQREGLEQLRALALGFRILVLAARGRARGIDTEDDLLWARARVSELGEAAFP
ncbi:MAG: 3-deoxy-manno-octulosonate cytidylyltransferase [Deltaproteobacteria bacterium]|nr:3-deoxy-manno-octulosonate cytidylyltransferase [Deltaproteobacteria bacterium]